jgi:hypothetical protein
MRAHLTVFIRCVCVAIFCILVCGARSAVAQSAPILIQASSATKYARYYAPYALQAAAAYDPVSGFNGFDATLRNFHPSSNPALQGGDPPLNGADVELAVGNLPSLGLTTTVERARKYLEAWQYQFGSDTYLSCYDTSDADCMKAYQDSGAQPFYGGPAFQVWARTHYPHVDHEACSEVSIAFRGTAPTSWGDWISNVQPVTSYLFDPVRNLVTGRQRETDDYYHQLRRNIDAILKRVTSLDCYKRAAHNPQIVSVGHSLGGGLAQFVALANNRDGSKKPSAPRISKVFAFDSSPVTAAGLIDRNVRDYNAQGLEIDRIYQPGEVLSKYLTPVAWLQYPRASSTCGPLVRTVRVDAVEGASSIDLHDMKGLAANIVQLSYINQTQLPYDPISSTGCSTRYVAPTDDNMPVPSISPAEQTVYAPNGAVVREARAGQYGPIYDSAARQFAPAASAGSIRMGYASDGSYGLLPEPDQIAAMQPIFVRGHHTLLRTTGKIHRFAEVPVRHAIKRLHTAHS